MSQYDIAKTAYSRIFLIEGKAAPNHEPLYQSCMKAGGISQGFGDIQRIECPSETEFGQFDEVGTIQGAIERASSTLTGRYAADLASDLLRLARQRCEADVHCIFGKCSNPRDHNVFTKMLIWESASLTNYSTDDLGAISSDENAAIMENSDISIGEFYEVLQLTFQERAPDVVINSLVDAVICDQITCGDCDQLSDGCYKSFVLQGGLTGSPGTAPDVIYTDDKGGTWGTNEISSMTSAETANALACLGLNLIVVSNDSESLHYKAKTSVLAGTLGGWIEVDTGFETGGNPNDIWSVGVAAFIVGDGGYVYYTTDPATGVVVLDAGVATSQDLNAIHALDDKTAVAVGDSDAIIFTTNRVTWSVAVATGGGANLQAVWMRSETEWWVVDDAGDVYYTLDSGQTWTEKALAGFTPTALYDIQFPTPSIGYVAGYVSTLAVLNGYLWRTYDGGYSWVVLPEGVGSLPGTSSQFNAIASCDKDVNYLVVAGQTAADDGVLLVGED